MTTSQEMDAQFEGDEIQRRLADLERKVEAYEQGGFDTFRQFGYLQLGLDKPRLDSDGIQFQTPTPATGDVPGLYWLNQFSLDPESEEPRAYLAGRADPSTATFPNGIFTFRLEAISGDRYARLLHSIVANGTAGLLMQFSHKAGEALEYGQFGGDTLHFHRFQGGDYIQIYDVPLYFAGMTADPASLSDGMLWYNTTDDSLYARINGATVGLGEGGGMNKVTGSGYLVMPAAASGISPANSGSAWTNGAWSEVLASTAEADSIIGILFGWDDLSGVTGAAAEIDIGTGAAAAEVAISTLPVSAPVIYNPAGGGTTTSDGANQLLTPVMLPAPIEVASGTRVAVRVRSSSTASEPANIRLIYAKASELVAR